VEWYEKYKDEFCPLKARAKLERKRKGNPAVFVFKSIFATHPKIEGNGGWVEKMGRICRRGLNIMWILVFVVEISFTYID